MIRAAVFGTGALGTYLAARLGRAGAAVRVYGTWEAGSTALGASGARIEGTPATCVEVASPAEARACHDLVLVATKSYRTDAIASAVAASRAPQGLVITVQNGLGNLERLRAAAGPGAVAAGATTAGVALVAPGIVRVAAPGEIVLGVPSDDPIASLRLDRAFEALTAAGLDVRRTDDLDAMLWRKVAVNCAINPLAALAGVENGALVATASRRRWLRSIAIEVATVARAAGVDLALAPTADAAVAVARATAANRGSMLQDLATGRPTEIEALCGAVAATARRHACSAPLAMALAGAVRAAERAQASGVPRAAVEVDALLERLGRQGDRAA